MAPKQVIVMRKDLNMRKGKMVAQGCHAVTKVFFDRGSIDNACNYSSSDQDFFAWDIANQAERKWIEGSFTKICVSVMSEQELLEIYNKAKEAGIICALVQDAGKTEFNGVPTFTCCAIGPDTPEKIDPITGHLPLL